MQQSRLGTHRLKAVMLRQLHAERPDVTRLLTGNSPMLRINVRLGYRPSVPA
jgi:hypothetical protein